MSPVSLYPKKPTFEERLEMFLMKHMAFFVLCGFITLFVLMIVLIYALVGVSATESGTVYNHFSELI